MYKKRFEMKELREGATVTKTEHALVVRGSSVEFHLMSTLANFAQSEYGYDRADLGVAECLGAILVLTNLKGSAAMRAEIDEANKDLPQPGRWFAGYDTGNSSLTIADCFCIVPDGLRNFDRSTPRDVDDFGRCVRLLEVMPEWKARLSHVGECRPDWKGLVEAWPALEALYHAGDVESHTELQVILYKTSKGEL